MIVRLKVKGGRTRWLRVIDFNSMIVRLKEVDKEIVSGLKNAFQFYDSPIKSLPASVCLSILYDFNSMIVRLKEIFQ